MVSLYVVTYQDESGYKVPTWGYWSEDAANDAIQDMIDEHPCIYNLSNMIVYTLPVEELHAHTMKTLRLAGYEPKNFLELRKALDLPQDITAEQLLLSLLTNPQDNLLKWIIDLAHDTKTMERLGAIKRSE